jgi:hypothetical protein
VALATQVARAAALRKSGGFQKGAASLLLKKASRENIYRFIFMRSSATLTSCGIRYSQAKVIHRLVYEIEINNYDEKKWYKNPLTW